MSAYNLVILFSFSITIAAIIGCVRFKKINPVYFPFLYFVWAGLLNEVIGYIITHEGYSNAVNNNIYALIESLLITWQFKTWGLFKRVAYLFVVILLSFIIFWVVENTLMSNLNTPISYFRVFYSFVIVLMSINILNQNLSRERRNIIKNSAFLICLAFLINYSYSVIVGVFWLYGLEMNRQFRVNIVWILIYVNLFANLIYAFAVLWMPTKHRFSLPS